MTAPIHVFDWANDPSSLPAPYRDAALACEHALLGAVLVRNERYAQCVAAGVKSEHFLSDLNARLWHEIGRMVEAGQEANPFTLTPRLAGERDFEALGGHRYLGRLATCAIGIGEIASHAGALRHWAGRRAILDLGQRLYEAGEDGGQPIEAVLDDATASLDACRPPPPDGGLQDFAPLFEQAMAANRRVFERGALDGVPFGLAELDALLGGIARSDLTVVAGRPGMGKSAFGLGVALHNARQGRRTAFFSMEMSALQLVNRVIGEHCGIGADRLRDGRYSAAQAQAMAQQAPALASLPLTIDATPALTPGEVLARVQHCLQRSAQPLELLVVDYAQLMTPPRRGENRVQDLTQITNGMKNLAKRLNLPVLLLSQLNRGPEQRDDKRPMLADLRESGSLEQDADQVLLLYREHYYLQQQEPNGEDAEAVQDWMARMRQCAGKADVIVAKNRHGATGTVRVGFDNRLTRFHDLVRS